MGCRGFLGGSKKCDDEEVTELGIFDRFKKKKAESSVQNVVNHETEDLPLIMQVNKVDGMAKSKDGNKLALLIIDELDWEEEDEHLVFLQEKINAYIDFIESKQYNETYSDDVFDGYMIQISFRFEASEKCKQFLEVASHQVQNLNITIMAEVGE